MNCSPKAVGESLYQPWRWNASGCLREGRLRIHSRCLQFARGILNWACPCVVTNYDSAENIIKNGENGWIVNRDSKAIYEKVKNVTLNASFNQVEQLKAVSTYDGAEIFEEISEKGA